MDEDAFLRAICEQPDEDTPRLVFADWLSEQGGAVNTAWANGIRAQIWQARGDTTAAFVQQSRVFESSYGQVRVRERLDVPSQVRLSEWERGFPSVIENTFMELRDHWSQLAFRIPIRKLHIYEVSEASAAEFLTWPGLSVLRELTFATTWEHVPPYDALSILDGCAGLIGLELLTVQRWFAPVS